MRCIMLKKYGMFGYGVHEEIYKYIVEQYGYETADNLLYKSKHNETYIINNYNKIDVRFNEILHEAFDHVDSDYHNGYVVVEGFFNIENNDGVETNCSITFS